MSRRRLNRKRKYLGNFVFRVDETSLRWRCYIPPPNAEDESLAGSLTIFPDGMVAGVDGSLALKGVLFIAIDVTGTLRMEDSRLMLMLRSWNLESQNPDRKACSSRGVVTKRHQGREVY